MTFSMMFVQAFELARRDVDQHLVHGPFTEPVFRHRPFPTGKGLLLAVEATKPRTRDLHLAAVETDLAFRLAPAMRRPVLATPMARTARRLRIGLHHLAKRLASPAARQSLSKLAEMLASASIFNSLAGIRSGCDKSVPWRCFPLRGTRVPRAYRLKASNAASSISTMIGTSPSRPKVRSHDRSRSARLSRSSPAPSRHRRAYADR